MSRRRRPNPAYPFPVRPPRSRSWNRRWRCAHRPPGHGPPGTDLPRRRKRGGPLSSWHPPPSRSTRSRPVDSVRTPDSGTAEPSDTPAPRLPPPRQEGPFGGPLELDQHRCHASGQLRDRHRAGTLRPGPRGMGRLRHRPDRAAGPALRERAGREPGHRALGGGPTAVRADRTDPQHPLQRPAVRGTVRDGADGGGPARLAGCRRRPAGDVPVRADRRGGGGARPVPHP